VEEERSNYCVLFDKRRLQRSFRVDQSDVKTRHQWILSLEVVEEREGADVSEVSEWSDQDLGGDGGVESRYRL